MTLFRHSRQLWLQAIVVGLPAAVAVGCSEPESFPIDANNYEVTDAILSEMLTALDADCATMDAEQALAKAASFLRGNPAIEAVEYEYSETQVLLAARFKNGIRFVMPVIDQEDAPSSTIRRGHARELASNRKALESIGVARGDALFLDLAEDLEPIGAEYAELARKHGYQVDSYSAPIDSFEGLDFLQNASDYGLVYVNSHGLYLTRATSDFHFFILQTNERRSQERDEFLWERGDFTEDRIVLGQRRIKDKDILIRNDPKFITITNYHASAKFLDNYLHSFEDFSLVYFDACHSAQMMEAGQGHALAATLLEKNAGTVMAWLESPNEAPATETSDYFFDRLFGENAVHPQAPPIRPYSSYESYQALVEQGLDVIQGRSVIPRMLVWLPQTVYTQERRDVLVRPALETVSLSVSDEELTVHGDLGDLGGKVCLSGRCIDVGEGDDWCYDQATVECDADFSGPVWVEVNDIRSNSIPLTSWNGRVTLEGHLARGLEVEGDLEYHIRADIHRQRYLADHNAGGPLSVATFGIDSQGTLRFSGEYLEGDTQYEYSGEKRITGDSQDFLNYLSGTATLDMESGLVDFIVGATAIYRIKETDLQTGEVTEYDGYYDTGLDVPDLPIGDAGRLEGGQKTVDVDGLYDISVEPCDAEDPPDENTPA